MSYFDDALFIGDSLTRGFQEYSSGIHKALHELLGARAQISGLFRVGDAAGIFLEAPRQRIADEQRIVKVAHIHTCLLYTSRCV